MEKGSYTRQKKKKKNGLVIAKLLSFRGFIGVCQADYLTSADQVIPDWLIKTPFWGEPKL